MSTIPESAKQPTTWFLVIVAIVGSGLFTLYFILGRSDPENPILGYGFEDGLVEYLGAAFWITAAGICAYRLLKGQPPRLLLAFWMLLAFFSFGEEISWFQRIIGFETPVAVAEINTQNEFNFHNLTNPLALDVEWVFRAGFITYFLFLPIVVLISTRARSLASRFGYVVPSRGFLVSVWTVMAVSIVLQLLGPAEALRVTAESRESFFAFVILVYVYLFLRPSDPRPEEGGVQLSSDGATASTSLPR